jgi:pullulanase/glycogen debranching enzyme
MTDASAQWTDRSTIVWPGRPVDGKQYALVGARTVRLHPQGNALRLASTRRVKELLRGQLSVTERDDEGRLLAVTEVQTQGVLDDVYASATSATLGPTFPGGRPALAVWAPTATDVRLELSDRLVPMRRDERSGVWSVTGDRTWIGQYYRYRVTVWQPAVQRMVTASVTDPYSVALAADSTHSQLVDLGEPPDWPKPAPVPPSRIQIQELSVRDFSIVDTSVPDAERGTYLGFTRPDSTGMKHLRGLAEAGLTHVHLLPVFDFATVPDRRADQRVPDCDLSQLPPDSDQQQACIAAVADSDGYNWGYDPLHYTVPEGSYATEPSGAARTEQFRQMVAALNRAGLRVIVDVVYNHTFAAGVDRYSVLDQIVPGYYHRLLDDGRMADSTCTGCANTAPEHAMMGKLVVDSVVAWARLYKVDGFRFDLMGHHPKENILAVRRALDQLTLARDGVDGKAVYLYGEGWDFGEVAGGARFVQATRANMAGTGIGTFNDRLRDAVRGGGPFDTNPRLQGFASGLFTDPNGDPANGTLAEQRDRLLHHQELIREGLAASPGESVTYVDSHDSEILYDALAYKLPPGTSDMDRARMQVLALSTVVLSQGVGFVAAGSDRLRSKSLDRNSYNSGDWFNQIRWDCADGNGFGVGLPPAAENAALWPYARPLLADPALVPGCDAIELAAARYRELLRVRASSPMFALGRMSFPLSGLDETPGVITMVLDGTGLGDRWRSAVVVFNATPQAVTQTLPAFRGADVALHPAMANSADPAVREASFDPAVGSFTLPARTVAVFVAR